MNQKLMASPPNRIVQKVHMTLNFKMININQQNSQPSRLTFIRVG
jgi:hypothetical protein